MGLRTKTAITVTCIFALVIVSTYLLFSRVLLGEFDAIERERTHKNLTRVFESIDGVVEDLSARTSDWGHWDETYDFIRGTNPSYVRTNLNYEAIAPFELVHLAILDKTTSPIFSGLVSHDQESVAPLPTATLQSILANPAVNAFLRAPSEAPLGGLITVHGEPVFISISQVSDNQQKRIPNGFLIFTRAFSPALHAQMAKRTRLPLSFSLTPDLSRFEDRSDTRYASLIETTPDTIIASGLIRDLNKAPIASVSFSVPRAIYQQGIESRDLVMSLMSGCLIFANLIVLIFLNKYVISRLERFASQIGALSETQQLSQRIVEDGGDEIGRLVGSFNGLLYAIEVGQAQLTEARDHALQANQAKSSFVAHVSHELRTPIHSLSGLLRILFKKEESRAKRAYIQMARDSAATLLATINDILDLSKIESGSIELQHIPFSLREVIHSSIRTVAPRVHEKPSVELLVDCEPGIPDLVEGDPLRLQQILVNLLGNASKFTQEGQISLSVKLTRGAATGVAPHVTFEVRDTGIGIAPERLSAIFQPYVQADETIQTRFQGTGLGLSIVTKLIEQLKGTIQVESEVGKGSVFKASVPLSVADPMSLPVLKSASHGVLIDEPGASSRFLTEGFARYGCAVRLISPLDRASLAQIFETAAPPDFLLLSHRAAQNTSLIDYVSGLTASSPLPVLVLLRDTDIATLEALQDRPGLQVIESPTTPEEILAIVEGRIVPQESRASQDDLSLSSTANRYRILVADDTATSRLIMQELLQEAGYTVEVVENGQQALDRIRRDSEGRCRETISLLITDIEMPLLNGMESALAIRNLERQLGRERLPIIAVTAHALVEEQARMISCGIDRVVTKPITPSGLDRALKDLLKPPTQETRSAVLEATDSTVTTLRQLTEKAAREVPLIQLTTQTPTPTVLLDIEDVFERSGESLRRTKLILSSFLSGYQEPLSKLLSTSDPSSSADLSKVAHSLKGLLLEAGAKEAARLASSIESAFKNGKANEALAQRDDFERQTLYAAGLIERVVAELPS